MSSRNPFFDPSRLHVDDEFDVVEVRAFGIVAPVGYSVRCLHARTVPVESVVDGLTLAHLCQTCDEQIPLEARA